MLIIAVVWTLLGFGLYGFNFVAPILLETVYHLNSYSQVSLLPSPTADAKLLRDKCFLSLLSLGPEPKS